MIKLRNIFKSYPSPNGGRLFVLNDVSIEFPSGSITSLFGPNGCGKSTLLSIVNGLVKPDSGTIQHERRTTRLGVVLQDYRNSLLPWLNLRDNILRPSFWINVSREAATSRLDELLGVFSIHLPLRSYPHEVSGGQAQLACLLRALVVKPDVLVLDEPTSALDFTLQWQTVLHLQSIWSKEKPTIILVSHDPEQALLLADRVVVFGKERGRIAKSVPVSLQRPRTFSQTQNSEFVALRNEVLQSFDADFLKLIEA